MKTIFGAILLSAVLAGVAQADPSCDPHPGYSAIDMSQPASSIARLNGKSGFQSLRNLGVKTIIRYYAEPNENITCKSLLPAESDAILGAGMNIVTVFQHEGDDPETFLSTNRGAADAKRALAMAGANGQPEGSAIYFAVDGVDQAMRDVVFEYGMSNGRYMSKARKRKLIRADASFRRHIARYTRFLSYHRRTFNKPVENITPEDLHPAIVRYFTQVKATFAAAKGEGKGYQIGGYGSGAVCELLFREKLVDYCWLSQSTGWPGYDRFYRSKRWSLVQQKQTFCRQLRFEHGEKLRFDFNRVNPAKPYFGQWNTKGPVKPLDNLPRSCRNGWASN